MTKLTRKLMISVFTLAFALVTLGASTFAWFTLTSTASVTGVSANMTSGEGIEVSVDGRNFVNNLTWSLIKSQIDNAPENSFSNIETIRLDAVTTADGYTFKKFNESSDLVDAIAGVDYLEIPIWFRSPTKDIEVKLSSNRSLSTPHSWRVDTEF